MADGKYVGLLNSIFVRAARDARPPKKSEHWAYLEPDHNPDFVSDDLTEQLDELLSAATEVMHYLDWQKQRRRGPMHGEAPSLCARGSRCQCS